MFGFKKNKNSDDDTTRHPQRPAGLPMDLYASYEIDDVKFHDKNAKWYKATEVDSLLDKIKQTLEWHEAREATMKDTGAEPEVRTSYSRARKAAMEDTPSEDKPEPLDDDPSLTIPVPLADAVDKINDEINSGSSNDAESSNDTDDYNYDLWRQSDYQEAKKTAGLTGVLSPTDIALRTTGSHATENNAAIMDGDRYIAQPESGDQASSSTDNDSSIDDGNASEQMSDNTPTLVDEAQAMPSNGTSGLKPVVPKLSPVDAPKVAVNPFLRH